MSSSSQRDHRARRWCARAFGVIGGAVAGTAAVWALSTTGAQAAPADADDRSPGNHQLADLPATAADAARKAKDRVGDALRTNDEPADDERPDSKQSDDAKRDKRDDAADRIDETSDEAFGNLDALSALLAQLLGGDPPPAPRAPDAQDCTPEFRDLCEQVEDWFQPPGELVPPLPPVGGDDPAGNPPGTLPAPGLSTGGWQLVPAADTAGHAADATVDVTDSATSPRGTPLGNNGGGPLGMPSGAPVPAMPGSGSIGAGHADSSPHVITGGQAATAAASTLMRLARALGAPVSTGAQPGVTPD